MRPIISSVSVTSEPGLDSDQALLFLKNNGARPILNGRKCESRRKRNDSKWTPLILFGGFAEVENNQVTILGNGAEEISSTLTKQDAQEMLDTVSETLENLKLSAETTEELSAAVLEVQIAKARVAALNLLSN